MLIAFNGIDHHPGAASVARELAALRRAGGSKVLLLAQAQDGCRQLPPYDDIVIDISCSDAAEAEAVLATASAIVIVVSPLCLSQVEQDALLARVQGMREANPHAMVWVAPAPASRALSPREVGAILVLVAQLAPARLVDTLVLDDEGGYRPLHRTVVDMAGDGLTMPEVRHLYQQVFHPAAMA